ncbi:hypothetical protein FSP39_007826 [Pinctada imbricata]|uniref:small monomeric GTPase n=1 Tax=Pinctada imbricata TaxID=66713 RepID=A0AA89C2U5_PINIB|nr:hypothetical protein FSP39_007826 [Pinctada imbricata]
MPLPSSSKDPKPAMEEKHSKHGFHSGKDINIVVAGMKGVGKSALTVRYLTRRFIGDYDSEMEAVYTHNTVLDGKSLTVHILDTAWQGDGTEIKEDQILWADAIVLVYSITDRTSFEKLREIADFVLSKRSDETKLVMTLVSNKCDLIHMQKVSEVEVTQFCAEYNCLFFEASASESSASVLNAFNGTCRQVRLTNRKREKLLRFMSNPAVAAKLQIRNSLKSLTEMKWRSRAPTM